MFGQLRLISTHNWMLSRCFRAWTSRHAVVISGAGPVIDMIQSFWMLGLEAVMLSIQERYWDSGYGE